MSWKKKISLAIGLIVILVYIGYRITYRPHTATIDRAIVFVGSSQELQEVIKVDELKWIDAALEISGLVTQSDEHGLVLDGIVHCGFDIPQKLKNIHNQSIHVVGRYIGYDELLEEVKLDRCIIIK